LQGLHTYRPNDITGAVLEVRPESAGEPANQGELPLPRPQPKAADLYDAGAVVYMTQPLSRPEALPGRTYKIRWPAADHAIYITINDMCRTAAPALRDLHQLLTTKRDVATAPEHRRRSYGSSPRSRRSAPCFGVMKISKARRGRPAQCRDGDVDPRDRRAGQRIL